MLTLLKSLSAFLLFTLLTVATVNAQISVDGDFRIRPEYRHGFQSLAREGQDPAFFTSQRSRIILGFKDPRYQVRFSLQDVRTWGSQSQTSVSDGLLSIHEAWLEYQFNKHFALKGGRMELAYDNHRILGNLDWAQQGRKHDLLLLKYTDSTFAVHAGFAYNQDKEQSNTNFYSIPNSYKTMQFLWMNKQFSNLSLSFLFLNNGTQYSTVDANNVVVESDTKFSQTTGFHSEFKRSKLFVNAFAYMQTGRDIKNRNVEAFDANIEVGLKASERATISAGMEYLSGTNNALASGTNRSFSPLYGTNHVFNGYMDYFYVGNHANNVGLKDLYVKLKQKVGNGMLSFDVHQFATAARILDPETSQNVSKSLGTEVDLTYRVAVSKELTVQAGYSHMFATATMEILKKGDKDAVNNWAYVWIIFKPDFMKKILKQD